MANRLDVNDHLSITTAKQLEEYCERAATEGEIGFDTEFVSEDTYENHLCLIQVATRKSIAVIDSMEIDDLSPFWKLITETDTPVIAHAAREEFCFAFRETGKTIPHLFDIQVAAGMIGMEYPAAYGKLVHRLLSKTLEKGETRTDWRKRPLSSHQIDYALQDVLYLHEIYDALNKKLDGLKRTEWFAQEMLVRQQSLVETLTGEVWRRLPGVAKLSPKALAAVRELWIWRDSVASESNRPARRVLRDDLLVELAKRGKADPKRIRAIRGMEYRGMAKHIDSIADCLARADKVLDEDHPKQIRKKGSPPVNLLTQFLSTSLSAICREAKIAPQIVGTSQDIRDWLSWRTMSSKSNLQPDELPAISQGWRAEIVGKQLEQLLAGECALSVGDPKADQPLVIKPVASNKQN